MSQRLGLVLGGFLAHFEPIIMGIKAQTQGIEWRTICDKFWSFLKGRSPLLGWKHSRAHILKGKSLKKKEIEEKEMMLSLKIVYSHPFFVSFFFYSFLSLRDVLYLFLGFCCSLATFEWING